MTTDKPYKNVTTPMDKEIHEKLREAAFFQRVTMREIIEAGIETNIVWRQIRKKFSTDLPMNKQDETDSRRSIKHNRVELFESLIQLGIEKLTPSIADELEACRDQLREVIVKAINESLGLSD